MTSHTTKAATVIIRTPDMKDMAEDTETGQAMAAVMGQEPLVLKLENLSAVNKLVVVVGNEVAEENEVPHTKEMNLLNDRTKNTDDDIITLPAMCVCQDD